MGTCICKNALLVDISCNMDAHMYDSTNYVQPRTLNTAITLTSSSG